MLPDPRLFSLLLLCWLSMIAGGVLAADQHLIDSLKQIIDHSNEDTLKAKAYTKLAWQFMHQDPDKAEQLVAQGLALSQKHNFQWGISYAYATIAVMALNKSHYDTARHYQLMSLAIAEALQDSVLLASNYNTLCIINRKLGNFEEALEYAHKTMAMAKGLGREKIVGSLENTTGLIYGTIGNYDKALEHFQNAVTIAENLKDTNGLAHVYNNLGLFYQHRNNMPKALEYYLKDVELMRAINHKHGLSKAFSNAASVYETQGQHKEALAHYQEALQLAIEIEDIEATGVAYMGLGTVYLAQGNHNTGIATLQKGLQANLASNTILGIQSAYQNIGKAYLEANQPQTALHYLDSASILADSLAVLEPKMEAAKNLSKTWEQLGNYQKALAYHQAYTFLKDSLFDLKTDHQIKELETKYESQKKEQALQMKEAELAQKDATLEKRRIQQYAITGGALLMLILAGVILIAYWQKRKDNNTLVLQNQEIERQQKHILEKNTLLEQKNEDLYHLNQEKNQLVDLVAHDLKNPLHAIHALIYGIRKNTANLAAKQVDQLGVISNYILRMNDMITRILDMSQLEARKLNLEITHTNISALIQDIADRNMANATEKQITLQTTLPTEKAQAQTDPNYFTQVIENLLSNAIKFSPPGKTVKVVVEEREDNIRIAIMDEGPGLTAQDLKKLWFKNTKLSAQPTNGEHSSGLGLFIAKKYIDALQGRIWCESEYGAGATFFVEIQRSAEEVPVSI